MLNALLRRIRSPAALTAFWRVLALVALGLALKDGVALWNAWRFDHAIGASRLEPVSSAASSNEAASGAAAPVAHDEPPAVLFAHAHRAAALGRSQEALALYAAAAADARVAPAALYNSGNIHLREALALAERNALAQTPQPVELAKRLYREALRADASAWPAKYNLERALWLSPELDEDTSPPPPPLNSERAVTTMRGFTLGLP